MYSVSYLLLLRPPTTEQLASYLAMVYPRTYSKGRFITRFGYRPRSNYGRAASYYRGGRKPYSSYYRKRKATPTRMKSYGSTFTTDTAMTKLKYTKSVLYTNTSGDDAMVLNFYGNNIFDPEVASGGGQPMGRDQWHALYGKVYVGGSKIKVTVINQNTAKPINVTVISSLDNFTASTVFSSDISEQAYSQTKLLGPMNGGGGKVQFKGYMSTPKIWGVPDASNDENFIGTSTAGPARLWYWCIALVGIDVPIAEGDIDVAIFVELKYYCKFLQRVNPGNS